jgi:exosortase/archaeosortase
MLATLALVMISLAVFKVLPELADLIFDLKKAMTERGRDD